MIRKRGVIIQDYLKKYYPNLKIIGITEENFIHNFVIRTDYPELVSIMNKVIKSISDKDKKDWNLIDFGVCSLHY